jgi:DNA-binding NarL/FixJ family response regulator
MEATQQFRALRPDVTLMDLQMPEMSGVIAIRGEFPGARVIVLNTFRATSSAAGDESRRLWLRVEGGHSHGARST